LLLEEGPAALPSGEEVAAELARAAAERLERAFPGDDPDVAGFRARMQCLREWMPELNLPPLDDEALKALLPQVTAGRRSLDVGDRPKRVAPRNPRKSVESTRHAALL
jgi:ATP-dependent helicase HrpB